MRKVPWLWEIALGCIFFSAATNHVAMSAEGEKLLIVNWDTANMWNEVLAHTWQESGPLNAAQVKAELETIVDEHAKAKVDMIVHCIFTLPWGTVPPDYQSFNRIPDQHLGYTSLYGTGPTGLQQLEDAGYDLIQVLLDRSHKDGVQFVGGLRMNDRHGGATSQPWVLQHPEWKTADGYPDYKHQGVRDTMVAVAADTLERYDMDGIELDWMRWCRMFKSSEAVQNAPLLTDFMAKMRNVLDQAAKKRGRGELLLGVRVPQTIEECRLLGFDVKAWVQKGLVDFITPSDFSKTDFNTKTDEFTALTAGTEVKVYPAIHSVYEDYTAWPTITGEYMQLETPENYRAAAKNFYAFGADGVSAYNYQEHYIQELHLGDPNEWSRSFSYLTELRDPASMAQGDRHYRYTPTSPTPGVMAKHEKIVLDRKNDEPADSVRFRMAEDLTDPNLSVTLEFKVTGMAEGDEFEMALNGVEIPADQFETEHVTNLPNGPDYWLYRTPLGSPPAKFGDNELRLRLTKSAGTAELVVQEVGVNVYDER